MGWCTYNTRCSQKVTYHSNDVAPTMHNFGDQMGTGISMEPSRRFETNFELTAMHQQIATVSSVWIFPFSSIYFVWEFKKFHWHVIQQICHELKSSSIIWSMINKLCSRLVVCNWELHFAKIVIDLFLRQKCGSQSHKISVIKFSFRALCMHWSSMQFLTS